jgi:pyrroline-5-carboxylate reductase
MGFALMKGIATLSGAANAQMGIGFTDAYAEKAKTAAEALGARVFVSNTEAAEKADFIFLAVKPQALSEVLSEIAPVIQKRMADGAYQSYDAPLLVSMAAGWTIEKIQAAIAYNASASMPSALMPLVKIPVARIMPNTPA